MLEDLYNELLMHIDNVQMCNPNSSNYLQFLENRKACILKIAELENGQ
jgi:hypothetical protein